MPHVQCFDRYQRNINGNNTHFIDLNPSMIYVIFQRKTQKKYQKYSNNALRLTTLLLVLQTSKDNLLDNLKVNDCDSFLC